MITLKNAAGRELVVGSEEQATYWEALGYARADEPKKTTTAKKATSSSKNIK